MNDNTNATANGALAKGVQRAKSQTARGSRAVVPKRDRARATPGAAPGDAAFAAELRRRRTGL